jgi:hypothetical protein
MVKRSISALEAGTSSTKSATPQRKKLCRSEHEGPSLDSKSVTILAGKSEKPFYVSEDVICSSSVFFIYALKKDWLEGKERTVKLPTVSATLMHIYLKWLYSGTFFFRARNPWRTWAACYEFGDFLQDTDFKDSVIDLAIELMEERKEVPYGFADVIYRFSIDGSPHRRFAVDVAQNFLDEEEFEDDWTPQEFEDDLLITMKAYFPMTLEELFKGRGCTYHEHSTYHEACYQDNAVFKF